MDVITKMYSRLNPYPFFLALNMRGEYAIYNPISMQASKNSRLIPILKPCLDTLLSGTCVYSSKQMCLEKKKEDNDQLYD